VITKADKQVNIFPSHIGLRKYIQYYNILFPQKDMFLPDYTLMPNACGTLSIAFDGNNIFAELWGASLSPIMLGSEPNGYQILLLIELTPIGLYQITRQNQAEYSNKRFPLSDIDNKLFLSLLNAFTISTTVEELVKNCEGVLFTRMEKHIVSPTVLLATEKIANSHGQIQVNELAQKVCYSERQLNRLFLSQVGTNIKNYARLMRFNYVIKHIQTSPCFLATLSQQAGYFDQAHLDKDFKLISGVSPQKYLNTMSDFYYDGIEICNNLSSMEE
jgi:AraC-like DNA-binding protein